MTCTDEVAGRTWRRRRRGALVPLAALLLMLSGCGANIRERYYLAAHDPGTSNTNYFRITISGQSTFSDAKYSVGLYDKHAVERLFGETALEHEYLSTRIDRFGADGRRLESLAERLAASKTSKDTAFVEELKRLAASASEEAGRLEAQMGADPDKADLRAQTAAARSEIEAAVGKLGANPEVLQAATALRSAYGRLETVRTIEGGKVLVRFFDGAGNEMDVANRSQVIFVASDASRFLEALRQLAEDEQVSHDVVSSVLGPKILESQDIEARLKVSDRDHAALVARLDDIVAQLPATPSDTDVQRALRDAGSAIAGAGLRLDGVESIRDFVRGRNK